MEQTKKPKTKLWPLFFAIFVIVMMAIIVVTAVIGLRETAESTYYIGMTGDSIGLLHDAQISFEKTRTYSKELVFYAGDEERASQAGYLIFEYLDRIDASLNHSYAYIVDAQEMTMAQELSHLMIQYRDYMERMAGLGYTGDAEAIQALLLETEPLANAISDAFEWLFMYNQDAARESAWQAEQLTNTILLTLISVAVVAFILIIIAAIVLIIITKPQETEIKPVASGYQYRYASDYAQNGGLSQTELQQSLADLKTAINELSQVLKERQ